MVFDGVNGILNGDESLPYPPKVHASASLHKLLLISVYSFIRLNVYINSEMGYIHLWVFIVQ